MRRAGESSREADRGGSAGSSEAAATAATAPTSSRRLAYLDALRALAVTLVIVMHAGVTIAPGDGGVVVFFVISGYIITRLLLEERDRTGGFDVRGFYRRRVYKLAPPLLVVLVVPTLVYAWFRPVDWISFAAQLGFVYNWTKVWDYSGSLLVLPGTEVVWSLAIEEQFYIGFSLLWLLLIWSRRGVPTLFVGALVVAAGSLLTRFALSVGQPSEGRLWDPERLQHVIRGTDTRIEAIALGVAVAAYFARGRPPGRTRPAWDHPAYLVAALLLFVSASLVFRGWWGEAAFRPTAQALATALAILHFQSGAAWREGWVTRTISWWPVQAAGLASYSIYLVHGPVLIALEHWWPAWPGAVLVVVRILVSMVAGYATYRLVEVPVLAFRRRRDAAARTGPREGEPVPLR